MKAELGKFKKNGRRRVNIRIDKHDTWNCDHTLAVIMFPLILQLRETKMGVPSEFAEVGGANYDTQDSFDFYKETHNESFDKKSEEWDIILNKILWSLQQIIHDDFDEKYHHGKPEYDWVPSEEKFLNPVTGKIENTYTMIDKNPNEHWYDIEGHKLHEERIQEGLELLGKYFRNLWD